MNFDARASSSALNPCPLMHLAAIGLTALPSFRRGRDDPKQAAAPPCLSTPHIELVLPAGFEPAKMPRCKRGALDRLATGAKIIRNKSNASLYFCDLLRYSLFHDQDIQEQAP